MVPSVSVSILRSCLIIMDVVNGLILDCLNCRTGCCDRFRGVFLLPGEKQKLSNLFDVETRVVGKLSMMLISEDCCKDSKNRICKLGENRPFDCKLYPLAICYNHGFLEIYTDINCSQGENLNIEKIISEVLPIVKQNKNWFSEYRKYLFDDKISGNFNPKLIDIICI